MKTNNVLYVFVILQGLISPEYELKRIMYEKRILSRNGVVMIYATFRELYMAYRQKFAETAMWGIGFEKDALRKAKLISKAEEFSSFQDKELECIRYIAKGIDFSNLDIEAGEAFVVAPNGIARDRICVNGEKEVGRKVFKEWWCKGLRNDCCGKKSDLEIADYLNGNYNRFNRRNYKEIDEKNVITHYGLIPDIADKEYSLLDLTPKELHG